MKNEYLKKGRVKQKQETREKILSSTQELMNYGEKFTLEDVAEKAGVSRATIYRYYSNIDLLSAEAGIDINTKSPKTIYENLQGLEIKDKLLGVQEYYNNLALDNENAFRNYLSIVLTSDSQHNKRGARRSKTLKMVLEETNLTKTEIKNIQNLFTVLMGVEPLIVTKDVCGLNNEQSKKLLKWGMELLLKGISIDRSE
ncbi:TetR/AcrR family transcriptional regulator [Winogradskyella psychrotolerans]|uniref:TetR/AcrR family transcriptional regulator n=1 Tax=Winogradskyella psychrotolerans TaxID=1344585 RepID=UPI001C073DFC|nr:TetR/AcrR family transcriptional regulator [Winogradskyella psychrotolerans]MBU2928602.1 TetR/AcrR family transcriptional regulator [Winogradskyella psychrotolerans]